MKKKFICTVCGYIHEGDHAPEKCPVCSAGAAKFNEMTGEAVEFVDEHIVGVAQGCDAEVWQGLKENFEGECKEVGMYIAMSRQAHREGYPEIGEAFLRYALEEAEHAAKFAELMGEVLTTSTEKNVQMRYEAEAGANAGKKAIATRAKELGYDAIHDTVHEMAKDEARHGRGFKGLHDRYFGNK